MTLIAPNATKVYDGTTLRTTTASDLTALSSQLVGGDRVSAAEIVYGDKNVGSGKRVTLTSNSLVIDDGNQGANYRISVTDSTSGVITKANLTITAVSDAKFVTQSDTAGYSGVVYNGFVAGENATNLTRAGVNEMTVGSVTRTNSGVIAAGSYNGVLAPAGFSASNYEITYQSGSYTIVPANTLLVRAGSGETVYGTTPTYTTAATQNGTTPPTFNLTAQYLTSNGSVINAFLPTVNGNQISISDATGTTAQFNLAVVNGSYSSSNNLKVGGYDLAVNNVSITGSNFNNMVLVGALTVAPKKIDNILGVQTISKVYDGSTSITGLALNFDRGLSGVIGNDVLALSGSGSYNDRNVGVNKGVTISMGLSGADAQNYALQMNNLNANVGTITQLASVQYVGAANGSWSDSRNWAGGALPDANNVAHVIIPTNISVVYDSAAVGVTGSTISNSGNIIFASANPFNLTNTISGAGAITQRGAGNLTISGNNTMTGVVDIGSYNLTLANANALGTATLVSNGGNLSITSNVVLPNLNTSGSITLVTAANIANSFTANGYVNALSGITTGGDLTANNGISIAGLANIGNNFLASGAAVSILNGITTGGNLTANNGISITGAANIGNNFLANGQASILNGITTAGKLTANNGISISGLANIGNDFLANGFVTISNGITTGGNLIANNGISVTGLTNVGGNLLSAGSTSFANDVTVAGNLSVNGASTFAGFVNTVHDQTYNGALTFTSSGTPYSEDSVTHNVTQAAANFKSTLGNISFMGTVSAGLGSKLARRNLVVSASNGSVLFNDQVGQNVITGQTNTALRTISFSGYNTSNISPNVVDVQAKSIKLFGDITSFDKQQYRGAVSIGDNGSNGYMRLLLSMDPSISFTGTIDDVTAGQHTLILRALTLNSAVPTITLGDVGLTKALASLDVLTGSQNQNSFVTDISPDRSTYVGSITLTGNITTTNNQMFVGDTVTLANGTTLRSNLGSIEMITGTHGGGVVGLSGAQFSFGTSASGFGSVLGQLGAKFFRDQSPVQTTGLVNSYHGMQHVQLNEWVDRTNRSAKDNLAEAADVQIGDLKTVNCDPSVDENCRIN